MGNPVTATLAYGYDLGDFDTFRVHQVDDDGMLTVPWWDEDGDEFPVQLYNALHAAIPDAEPETNADRRQKAAIAYWGVQIAYAGRDSFEAWALIATGSEQEAHNAQIMVLDLLDMEHPPDDWFSHLTDAVDALGITPKQQWPRWLVFPSEG